MKAKPSPLKCTSYFVTDLVLTANPNHDQGKPPTLSFSDLNTETDAQEFKPEKGEPFWRVSLTVSQNVGAEKNSPYNFAVSLLGTFELAPGAPAERRAQIVQTNGASILFGVVREVLKMAMNNGPYRPLTLPTVTFIQPPAPEETPAAAES